jgi:hypothetical protein
MQTSLRLFVRQFIGVVIATLVPVVLVAFMSIPMALGGHPGESRVTDPAAVLHLS